MSSVNFRAYIWLIGIRLAWSSCKRLNKKLVSVEEPVMLLIRHRWDNNKIYKHLKWKLQWLADFGFKAPNSSWTSCCVVRLISCHLIMRQMQKFLSEDISGLDDPVWNASLCSCAGIPLRKACLNGLREKQLLCFLIKSLLYELYWMLRQPTSIAAPAYRASLLAGYVESYHIESIIDADRNCLLTRNWFRMYDLL